MAKVTYQVRIHSATNQNGIELPPSRARDGEHDTYELALEEVDARAAANATAALWYTIEKRYQA